MTQDVRELIGVDFPLLAFSHCRDVVAAVTNAGGFGVLGATGLALDELETDLAWIDDQVRGKPYGIDVLVPASYAGKDAEQSLDEVFDSISPAHRQFVVDLLARHGIRSDADSLLDKDFVERAYRVREDYAQAVLDICLAHPIRLIANALGPAPALMIEKGRAAGVPVAALVGSPAHALKQLDAGVDILVAQGYEAGGHTGEIGTMVLVPEVIAAVEAIRPVPVLAAGGIVTGRQMAAALALGAQGVWTGSVWLTTYESETTKANQLKMVAASSRDTVRSRARTGKPARQLRTEWHRAWEGPDSPGLLPMPYMDVLARAAFSRIDKAAERNETGAEELSSYFVGQGVGLMTRIGPAAQTVQDFMVDFQTASERLAGWSE